MWCGRFYKTDKPEANVIMYIVKLIATNTYNKVQRTLVFALHCSVSVMESVDPLSFARLSIKQK